MSEPTIDEMLAIVDSAIFNCTPDDAVGIRAAIRAILEQHRYPACAPMEVGHELKSIRAFVERVEKRNMALKSLRSIAFSNPPNTLTFWRQAMIEELAAMEKEAE